MTAARYWMHYKSISSQVSMAFVQMMVSFWVSAPYDLLFFCHGVSEEHTAFFFRVTELVHVDAAVMTSGAQFVKLFVGQFCPVPCYFLLLCPL